MFSARGLGLTVSNVGRYEREFARLGGGLVDVAEMLRDGRAAAALLQFARPAADLQVARGRGAIVRKKGYLPLSAIQDIWGNETVATAWVARMLRQGVLRRGLLLKCPHCLWLDWYIMDELADAVLCHQCRRQHVYSPAADLVHFRLDALVDQALDKNCHVPILALDFLRRSALGAFHFEWSSEVRHFGQDEAGEKPWMEIDFAAVVDGAFVLGECKTTGELRPEDRRRFHRYVELAKRIRPDRLLIATAAEEWTPATRGWLGEREVQLAALGVEMVTVDGSELGWPPALREIT